MNRWRKLYKKRRPVYARFQREFGRQHRSDFRKSQTWGHRNTTTFVKSVAKRRAANKRARQSRRRNRVG